MNLPTIIYAVAVWLGVALAAAPTINGHDERFMQWQPAGPGDSRSPCPALNSIANHGFIPHSGRNINLAQIVLGLFQGLGVSPETSGFIGAIGMLSSSHPLTFSFDLEDLSRHLFAIEHDCSFSRQDALIGNNNVFNPELWNVALAEMDRSSLVTPIDLGRAKSARIRDSIRRNPASVYGPRAAAFGTLEHGLVLSALGAPITGIAPLSFIRSFFEQERLPYHLGWRPVPFANNIATVLGISIASLAGDPNLLENAARVIFGTPSDIIQTIVPPQDDFLANLTSLVTDLGFDQSVMQPLTTFLQV